MATPEGHNELIPRIIAALQDSDEPLDCNQLYDRPEIREVAPSAWRVSDYLGVLFRQGKLSRVQGGGGGRSRWSYVWRESATPEWRRQNKALGEVKDFVPKAILDRPNIYIAEDGNFINIEMPELTITIKHK